jgi:DNA-binding Xre family transcriptional regulator
MIRLDLKRLCDELGIENPNKFLRKCGITSYTATRLLSNQQDSIGFRYLETICLNLHCTIDDLFTYTPKDKLQTNHPLNKLIRLKKKESISSKLKGLPSDKLDQIRNFIDEIEKTNPST